jgi:hypothetical protein
MREEGHTGLLVGKPEGKRPPGRRSRRWEGNIKIGLREIGWVEHGVDKSGSGQVAGSCEYRGKPSGSVKYGEFLE